MIFYIYKNLLNYLFEINFDNEINGAFINDIKLQHCNIQNVNYIHYYNCLIEILKLSHQYLYQVNYLLLYKHKQFSHIYITCFNNYNINKCNIDKLYIEVFLCYIPNYYNTHCNKDKFVLCIDHDIIYLIFNYKQSNEFIINNLENLLYFLYYD